MWRNGSRVRRRGLGMALSLSWWQRARAYVQGLVALFTAVQGRKECENGFLQTEEGEANWSNQAL